MKESALCLLVMFFAIFAIALAILCANMLEVYN